MLLICKSSVWWYCIYSLFSLQFKTKGLGIVVKRLRLFWNKGYIYFEIEHLGATRLQGWLRGNHENMGFFCCFVCLLMMNKLSACVRPTLLGAMARGAQQVGSDGAVRPCVCVFVPHARVCVLYLAFHIPLTAHNIQQCTPGDTRTKNPQQSKPLSHLWLR